MPSNPNYMEVCPPAQAVGWLCESVTPANLLRNISNTHAVNVPTNNPSFHPMFHTEKLLKKLQRALLSFYCLDHAIGPQEIMFHHQTQGSYMCLPCLHHSSLTQGTLSPASIFGSLSYTDTFPSSSHASYLLCSIFTHGWATSQLGGLFHSRDSPISNLPSSYKYADST